MKTMIRPLMENHIKTKDDGIKKMQEEKYEESIKDFTSVIEKIKPKTDEEAVLLNVCFLNRSACHTFLGKYDAALEDADSVIKLYNIMRPEEIQKKYNAEQIKADNLIVPLSLAYVRRGQVFESQAKLLDALHEYTLATALKFDGDGQNGMKSVFSKIGIPELDQRDPDLSLFTVLVVHFLSEVNLLTGLTNLMTFLTEGNPDSKWITKINDSGCCRVLYGIMQLYMENEMIVVGCIASLRLLAERGTIDSLNGFIVLRVISEHWKRNINVIAEVLRLLVLSPPQLMPHLVRSDFIPIFVGAMDLLLKPEEYDYIFYLLFRLSETQDQLVQLGVEGAIEKSIRKRSKKAMLFLSKACQLGDNARVFIQEEGIDWALEMIEKNPEDHQILGSGSILIAQSYMVIYEDKELGRISSLTEIDLGTKGIRVFELLFPIASKLSKEAELVSNIYAALASCAEYAKEFIHEKRVIQASSAILTMNANDEGCALNIIALFYNCCVHGLVDEIKNTRSAMPTVLNELKIHSSNVLLVERAVAITCEVNHPKKAELFNAALKQQPESNILKKYLETIDK